MTKKNSEYGVAQAFTALVEAIKNACDSFALAPPPSKRTWKDKVKDNFDSVLFVCMTVAYGLGILMGWVIWG